MPWPDKLPRRANNRRWGWCIGSIILFLASWVPISSVYDHSSHMSDLNKMHQQYTLVSAKTTTQTLDLSNGDVGTKISYGNNQLALLDLSQPYSVSAATTTVVIPNVALQVYIGPGGIAHFTEPNIKWNPLLGLAIPIGIILCFPMGILFGHIFYKFCFMLAHRQRHKRRSQREAELTTKVREETKRSLMVDNPDLYKQSLLELVNEYDVTPGEAKIQDIKQRGGNDLYRSV